MAWGQPAEREKTPETEIVVTPSAQRWGAHMIRAVLSFFIAALVLALQNSSYADRTVLAVAERELFDRTVEWRENTVSGPAPPVLLVMFDEEQRQAHFASAQPGSPLNAWPNLTPLSVVKRTMEVARDSKAFAVVVDADLAPPGYTRDPAEIAEFQVFLQQWAADASAPLAVFARATYRLETAAGRPDVTAFSPFDPMIAAAPNMVLASAGAQSDPDGVARHVDYYLCAREMDVGGTLRSVRAMPHAALFLVALAKGAAPAEAKREVVDQLASQNLCAEPPDASGDRRGFTLAIAGQALAFNRSSGLIDYHLSISRPVPMFGAQWELPLGVPAVAPGWGRAGAPVLNDQPFTMLAQNAGEVAVFPPAERAIVVLATSQARFSDTYLTPYGFTPGGLIVANVARGLIMHGPIKSLPLRDEFLILLAIVVAVNLYYLLFSLCQHAVLVQSARALQKWFPWGVARILTGPVFTKLLASGLIFAAGLAGGLIMLDLGLWEAFVAPAWCASLILALEDPIDFLSQRIKKEKAS